ncbi:protein artichoke-like [Uranotaenia lowii]|uniref:protein artichoke-like n=1 Tax=Uranotaenia lowii TaxID=190385 RepID=UPI0024794DB9|nr:protein artichoke-like [Uranotaenia lowii]
MELRFFRLSPFCVLMILLLSAQNTVKGYEEYICETDEYDNCYLQNVNIMNISANVKFSLNKRRSTVRFKNSHIIEIPKAVFETSYYLKYLDVFDCSIERVSRFTFEQASRLVELNMSSNLIERLGNYVFTGATEMKVLDLSNNQISNIELKAFDNLEKLRTLLLSGNKIRALMNYVFSPLTSLRELFLTRNELEVIQKDLFENKTSLPTMHLQSNRIHRLELNGQMQVLFAANNIISEIILQNHTIYNIYTLDLSRNNLTSMAGINELKALKVLDLSFNQIGSLEISSFSKLTALVDLNLESTKISNLQHGTFSHQTALQRLDISYNNLEEIDLDIFISSPKMEELYIDGNRLKEIKFEKIPRMFQHLKSLSIADNHWSCSFLIKMIGYLNFMPIGGFKTNATITDKTNVKGIYCEDDKPPTVNWNTAVKHLDKYMNDSIPIVDAADVKKIVKSASSDQISAVDKIISLELEINNLKQKIDNLMQSSHNGHRYEPVAVQQQPYLLPGSKSSSNPAFEVLVIILLTALTVLMGAGLFFMYRSNRLFGQRNATHNGNSCPMTSVMDNDF